jgi:DNA-binding NtrC family response regulator
METVGQDPALSSSRKGKGLPPLSPDGIDLPDIIAGIEKHYYESSLQLTNGNESGAAKLLGVSRDTFRYRRKKLLD